MVIMLVGALSSPVAMAACFRDSYGLLDHLSSDGFDYGNDGLFDPPRSFLHWRAFGLGLGNRSLCSFDYLACLTAFSGVCSSQFGSALYF